MTGPIHNATRVAPSAANDSADTRRLRDAASQLEGLFVRQLFAAMRDTVPTGGPLSGGAGEEMFTAMLHEHLADAVPARWDRGIAASVTAAFTPRPAQTTSASAAAETP